MCSVPAQHERLPGADLIIAPRQSEVFVGIGEIAECLSSAGIVGNRVIGHDLQSGGAQQCRGDFVPHERGAQGERLSTRLASRRAKRCEVSGLHSGRGNERDSIGWIGALQSALIAQEEKELVVLDGTSKSSSELAAFERVARGGEKVARIDIAIPEKFKRVA